MYVEVLGLVRVITSMLILIYIISSGVAGGGGGGGGVHVGSFYAPVHTSYACLPIACHSMHISLHCHSQ